MAGEEKGTGRDEGAGVARRSEKGGGRIRKEGRKG